MRVTGLMAAAGLAMSATTATAEPRVITQPDWLTQPTGDTLAEHYPMLATMLDIEGTAQISCAVTDKGLLEACKVDTEGPAGFGFGGAALAMSSAFRMKPQTIDGHPVSGGVVCIPLRFVLPDLPSAAVPAVAGAPGTQARAAALRLVESQAVAVEAAQETQLAALLANAKPDADAATREAAAKALRASVARNRARLRQVMADVVLAMLTPEEIQAIDAYTTATAGMAQHDMSQLGADLGRRVPGYIHREIRSEFCKADLCRGSPAELAAVAAQAGGEVADAPPWNETPTPERISAATPPLASLLGVSGAARLTCEARADGGLQACMVAAEAPARWGFGDAAIRLATRYRLGPVEGAAPGRRVTVRLAFEPPAVPAVEPTPAPKSAAAKAMARTLIETMTPPMRFDEQLAQLIAALTVQLDPSVAPQAETALRAAMPRAMNRLIDDAASMVAAQYGEAELSPTVTFMTSPAGRSAASKTPELQGPVTTAVQRHHATVVAAARAEFCASRACPPARHLMAQSSAASPEPSARKP